MKCCTRETETRLARVIEGVWAERGERVTTRLEPFADLKRDGTIYRRAEFSLCDSVVVRSDMVGGRPQRLK